MYSQSSTEKPATSDASLYDSNTQSYSNPEYKPTEHPYSTETSSHNSNKPYLTSSNDHSQTTAGPGSRTTSADNKLHYSYTMQIEDLPQSKKVSGESDKTKQRKRPLAEEEDINVTIPNAGNENKKLKGSSKEKESKFFIDGEHS